MGFGTIFLACKTPPTPEKEKKKRKKKDKMKVVFHWVGSEQSHPAPWRSFEYIATIIIWGETNKYAVKFMVWYGSFKKAKNLKSGFFGLEKQTYSPSWRSFEYIVVIIYVEKQNKTKQKWSKIHGLVG